MKWLYVIENNITGKEYIGVTLNPERRWKQHRRLDKTHCIALRDAMIKYGIEDFSFNLLCCGEDSYIDDLEVQSIKEFGTQVPNGYNITLGGEGTLYYEWSDDWNALLGTMTDRDLSVKIGVPHQTIGDRRRALNIPTYFESTKVDWDNYEHLFLNVSDSDIATMAGVSASKVQQERLSRGYKSREKVYYDITEDMYPTLLDTNLTQVQAAEETGLSEGVVNNWRRVRGIRYIGDGRGVERELKGQLLEDLSNPHMTYSEVAIRNNVSKSFVCTKRKGLNYKPYVFEWDNKSLDLLWGGRSDGEVAKNLGIGEEKVRKKRREIGVPKRNATKNPFLLTEPYFSEILSWEVSSKDLAKRWNVPVHQVTSLRRKHRVRDDNKLGLLDLTREDWLYIRYLYESGLPYRVIVTNIGLSLKRPCDIWNGLSGKSYSRVTAFKLGEVKKRGNNE